MYDNAAPVLTGCIFDGNLYPIQMQIGCQPISIDNSFINNTDNLIYIYGTATNSVEIGLINGLPPILSSSLTINSDVVVKIQNGLELNLNGNDLLVYGTLLADGVTFNGSVNTYDEIRFYAGSEGELINCLIVDTSFKIYTDDVSMNDCVINNEGYAGIYLYDNASPMIDTCTFEGNLHPIEMEVGCSPNISGSSFIDNTASVVKVYGTLSKNWIWPNIEGLPFLVSSGITVNTDYCMTIPAGTVIKVNANYEINAYGILIVSGESWAPVIFTSYRDDTIGGDSNGDGPSEGSAGDWDYIRIQNDSSTIEYCLIRYADYGVYCYNASPTILNATIVDAYYHGIRCYSSTSGASNPIITNAVLANNLEYGIFSNDSDLDQISYCASNNNANGDYTPDNGNTVFAFDSLSASGNMTADPLFVAPESGDFRLSNGSPCIDTGDPNRLDADDSRSDMGAYVDETISGATEVNAWDTQGENQSISLSWLKSSNDGNGSDNVSHYAIARSIPDSAFNDSFETGDLGKLDWLQTGDAAWQVEETDAPSGLFAAVASGLGDSQTAGMEVTLEVSTGSVSFYRKVSTASYDYLVFYIDDVRKGRWYGSSDWVQVSYSITQGVHTFKWTYEKDSSGAANEDMVWIDIVNIPTPPESLTFESIATVPAGTQIYLDNDVNSTSPPQDGDDYYYRIITVIDGTFQEIDSATTGPVHSVNDQEIAPLPVSDLHAEDTPNATESISLTWSLSPDDGAGGLLVEGYDILRSLSSEGPFMLVGSVSSGNSTFVDEGDLGPVNDVEYWYVVRAKGVTMYTDSTVFGSVRTWDDLPLGPAPPSNVEAADTPLDQGDSLTVSWTLSPDDGGGDNSVIGYHIYRRIVSEYDLSSEYVVLGIVEAGIASYKDAQTGSGVYLQYKVRATNGTYESVDTEASDTVVPIDNLAPQQVTGLQLAAEYDRLHIAWAEVPDADFDHYMLYWGENSGSYRHSANTAQRLYHTIEGLNAGSTYYAVVAAVDESGNQSILSDELVMATLSEDTTPPGSIDTLEVTERFPTHITLLWKAPGDDGQAGIAYRYDLRYSTEPLDNGTFSSAYPAVSEPAPSIQGTYQSCEISGLEIDATYYFAIKTIDEQGNVSDISNILTVSTDLVAPNAIGELAARESTATSVTLTWIARGDNGDKGSASSYDLRYSSERITEENFSMADVISSLPSPADSGSIETFTVTGMEENQLYYFAIKALDEAGNVSTISNIAMGSTYSGNAPVLYNVAQDSTLPGAVVSIYGARFGESQLSGAVIFSNEVPGTILLWRHDLIQCLIPEAAISGDLIVVTADGISNGKYVHVALDLDEDGMPDDWETLKGLDTGVADAYLDADGDGLSNGVEYHSRTDPKVVNSSYGDNDGDNMPDVWEQWYGLDLDADDSNADLDGDTLCNIVEYYNGTSPLLHNNEYPDADGDNLPDRWEIAHGFIPGSDERFGDADGDGILNYSEYQYGTDPRAANDLPLGNIVIDPAPDNIDAPWTITGPQGSIDIGSGDDILADRIVGEYTIAWGSVSGWAKIQPFMTTQTLCREGLITFTVEYGVDSDWDGLTDDVEDAGCTEANDADSDGDGILDGDEDADHDGTVDSEETDPCDWDSDDDGMPDGWEVNNDLNPLIDDASGDLDGDRFTNLMEYISGTVPTDLLDRPTINDGFDYDMDLDGMDLFNLIMGLELEVVTTAEVESFAEGFGR
jgi:hypothetical protein